MDYQNQFCRKGWNGDLQLSPIQPIPSFLKGFITKSQVGEKYPLPPCNIGIRDTARQLVERDTARDRFFS